jgi:hypothetical protein
VIKTCYNNGQKERLCLIIDKNTIFRKAPPSVVSGYGKRSINLNKVVATFEKHIFLSQTDLIRTGIIRSVIVIMKCLEIFQCQESIRDIIIYPHIKFGWHRTMLNFYHPFFMPCFGSHFENGRHLENFENTELLVDNNVPNWFLTLKNFYRSPFSKWPPLYRKNSTLSDIINIWYVGR